MRTLRLLYRHSSSTYIQIVFGVGLFCQAKKVVFDEGPPSTNIFAMPVLFCLPRLPWIVFFAEELADRSVISYYWV